MSQVTAVDDQFGYLDRPWHVVTVLSIGAFNINFG
jgi:hypothetical protein